MQSLLKFLFVAVLLGSAPAAKAQNAITFMGGTVGNSGISLSFSAGEPVSGTFSNASFSMLSGFTSSGNVKPTSIEEPGMSDLPRVFRLNQNYPNPFNPSTTIAYELPSSADVRIEVFNSIGIRVAMLMEGSQAAGFHTVQFNGTRLASGMYLYRFIADGKVISTKKMMLLK